jgi:hypothetical protein
MWIGKYDAVVCILRPICVGFRWSLTRAAVFSALLSIAVAQNSQPATPSATAQTSASPEKSVAAAVRDSKTQKTARAKKVFTEDDLDATATALPRLKMDGAENGDEIIAAIGKYKESHTPGETEAAVQAWYERYDEELAAAIQENLDVKSLREENVSNGYELCRQSGDYEKCENRRHAELVGARHDQVQMSSNSALEVRIQHVFMKVRNGLVRYNLHYDWFKVRTTNGIDVF